MLLTLLSTYQWVDNEILSQLLTCYQAGMPNIYLPTCPYTHSWDFGRKPTLDCQASFLERFPWTNQIRLQFFFISIHESQVIKSKRSPWPSLKKSTFHYFARDCSYNKYQMSKCCCHKEHMWLNSHEPLFSVDGMFCQSSFFTVSSVNYFLNVNICRARQIAPLLQNYQKPH